MDALANEEDGAHEDGRDRARSEQGEAAVDALDRLGEVGGAVHAHDEPPRGDGGVGALEVTALDLLRRAEEVERRRHDRSRRGDVRDRELVGRDLGLRRGVGVLPRGEREDLSPRAEEEDLAHVRPVADPRRELLGVLPPDLLALEERAYVIGLLLEVTRREERGRLETLRQLRLELGLDRRVNEGPRDREDRDGDDREDDGEDREDPDAEGPPAASLAGAALAAVLGRLLEVVGHETRVTEERSFGIPVR